MLTHSPPVHTYTPPGSSPWVVEGPCGGTGWPWPRWHCAGRWWGWRDWWKRAGDWPHPNQSHSLCTVGHHLREHIHTHARAHHAYRPSVVNCLFFFSFKTRTRVLGVSGNSPIMLPSAQTACSHTFWCGDWSSLRNSGTASAWRDGERQREKQKRSPVRQAEFHVRHQTCRQPQIRTVLVWVSVWARSGDSASAGATLQEPTHEKIGITTIHQYSYEPHSSTTQGQFDCSIIYYMYIFFKSSPIKNMWSWMTQFLLDIVMKILTADIFRVTQWTFNTALWYSTQLVA